MTAPTAITRALLRWFAIAARDLPWRRTRDPYAIWVSEVMLQQTTVQAASPYYVRWMRELPTVTALAAAPLERVFKLWEGLGYYRRATNLHRAARIIVDRWDGRFPVAYEDVLALPGVGRYTAGAVCSLAQNAPTPVLDGNVSRVLARFRGLREEVRSAAAQEQLWRWAGELVRAAQRLPGARPCGDLNEALMELGATLCTPKTPRCADCPLRRWCRARREQSTEEIPRLAARPAMIERRRVAMVWEWRRRWYVCRQPSGTINGGLWEFPQIDLRPGEPAVAALAAQAPAGSARLELMGTLRHTITRHRIRLAVYRIRSARPAPAADGRWCTREELQGLALSSAHRRIARLLELPCGVRPPPQRAGRRA